jgi:hypothetical protein
MQHTNNLSSYVVHHILHILMLNSRISSLSPCVIPIIFSLWKLSPLWATLSGQQPEEFLLLREVLTEFSHQACKLDPSLPERSYSLRSQAEYCNKSGSSLPHQRTPPNVYMLPPAATTHQRNVSTLLTFTDFCYSVVAYTASSVLPEVSHMASSPRLLGYKRLEILYLHYGRVTTVISHYLLVVNDSVGSPE